MPPDQLNARVDNDAKGHFVAQLAVTFNDSLHDGHDNINIVEYLPFVKVTDHLAQIVGSMTVLSKLPVDNIEFVGSSA